MICPKCGGPGVFFIHGSEDGRGIVCSECAGTGTVPDPRPFTRADAERAVEHLRRENPNPLTLAEFEKGVDLMDSDLRPLPHARRTFSSSVFLRAPDGDVLLVLHRRFDLWLPVGGEREGDETPIETAIREVYEETRVKLTPENFPETNEIPGTPPGFLCYEEHDAGSRGLHMNFTFFANISREDQNRTLLNRTEHLDNAWVDPGLFVARSFGTNLVTGVRRSTAYPTTANVAKCMQMIALMGER